MKTIEALALEKITGTIKTCLCCCSSDCKSETIVKLRGSVIKLLDSAINEHGRSANNDTRAI